jgi:K+-transporting ATPase ATPase A chain
MSPLLAFNTAISFFTGTNWQAYEGETQASYLADMAGLVVGSAPLRRWPAAPS